MDNLTRFDSYRNGYSIDDVEITCGLKEYEDKNIISAILPFTVTACNREHYMLLRESCAMRR